MAALFTIHSEFRYEIVRKIFEGGPGWDIAEDVAKLGIINGQAIRALVRRLYRFDSRFGFIGLGQHSFQSIPRSLIVKPPAKTFQLGRQMYFE